MAAMEVTEVTRVTEVYELIHAPSPPSEELQPPSQEDVVSLEEDQRPAPPAYEVPPLPEPQEVQPSESSETQVVEDPPQLPLGEDLKTDAAAFDATKGPGTPTGSKRSREGGEEKDGEKKWAGWPGDNVFRLVVPVQKVGGIIGRKGEFVKKMCEETRSRIKILEGVPGTAERIVSFLFFAPQS